MKNTSLIILLGFLFLGSTQAQFEYGFRLGMSTQNVNTNEKGDELEKIKDIFGIQIIFCILSYVYNLFESYISIGS